MSKQCSRLRVLTAGRRNVRKPHAPKSSDTPPRCITTKKPPRASRCQAQVLRGVPSQLRVKWAIVIQADVYDVRYLCGAAIRGMLVHKPDPKSALAMAFLGK